MNKLFYHIARKQPAFTLPEMVVGMLLMAILFSFISMVYLLFVRQANRQLDTGRAMQEYISNRHTLQYDLDNASAIYYNSPDNQFIFRTKASDTIIYLFDKRGILRHCAGHTDTLQPGATLIGKTFARDSLMLVNSITLEYAGRFRECRMNLYKQYAIADLLNEHR